MTDFVAGASGDKLNFSAFLSAASSSVHNTLASSVYTSIAAAKSGVADSALLTAGSLNNKVVILKGTVTDYDAAAEVADLFDTASDNNGTLLRCQ